MFRVRFGVRWRARGWRVSGWGWRVVVGGEVEGLGVAMATTCQQGQRFCALRAIGAIPRNARPLAPPPPRLPASRLRPPSETTCAADTRAAARSRWPPLRHVQGVPRRNMPAMEEIEGDGAAWAGYG